MQDLVRGSTLDIVTEYLVKVQQEGKVEDLRKAAEWVVRITGAETEKKADPNANLPVFHFTINNMTPGVRSIQAEVVEAPATPADVATIVQAPATPADAPTIVQAAKPTLALEFDLDDFDGALAALDKLAPLTPAKESDEC